MGIRGGWLPGMTIVKVELIPPPEKKAGEDRMQTGTNRRRKRSRPNSPPKGSVGPVSTLLQELQPGTKVQVQLADDGQSSLSRSPAADWFNPDRGLVFTAPDIFVQTNSFGQAIVMGVREARDRSARSIAFCGTWARKFRRMDWADRSRSPSKPAMQAIEGLPRIADLS